jgi:hypothetical protein
LISRNNIPNIKCSICGKNNAVLMCYECVNYDEGYFCNSCGEKHECGEEMITEIVNSPHVGVCGYSGSDKYPG